MWFLLVAEAKIPFFKRDELISMPWWILFFYRLSLAASVSWAVGAPTTQSKGFCKNWDGSWPRKKIWSFNSLQRAARIDPLATLPLPPVTSSFHTTSTTHMSNASTLLSLLSKYARGFIFGPFFRLPFFQSYCQRFIWMWWHFNPAITWTKSVLRFDSKRVVFKSDMPG